MDNHSQVCEAAICAKDSNPNYKKDVIWYPGEKVCAATGQKGVSFLRRQRTINRLVAKGEFKHLDRYFTAALLASKARIMKGTKGINPEAPRISSKTPL